MNTIQWSLFPRRGYALMVFGRLLVGSDGMPSVKPTRRAIRRLLARSAVGESAWFRDLAEIVRVTVHKPDPVNDLPSFIIETGPS